MTNPLRRLAAAALLPILLLVPSGCAVNPATGRTTFTGLMSTADEIRIGRAEHPKIVKAFGGVYDDAALARYTASIGQLLARTVERRDVKYKITLLNTGLVNAFAMPGGYIYITRGILALAADEAELAGVLAHELGHVAAMHHTERYNRSVLAGLGASVLGAATGSRAAAELGELGAGLYLRSYSRSHEYEADQLGIRYLTRAGYEPRAMASFLGRLRAHSKLQAKLTGQEPKEVDRLDYFATHPRLAERVGQALAAAGNAKVERPMRARDIYLGKIDGMLYGDDPKQGVIKGREFLHPDLRLRFSVPSGFRLFNSPSQVVAFGPEGSRIVFDMAPKPADGPMTYYVSEIWAPALNLAKVEAITINGLEAATGTARIRTGAGLSDARLVAVRFGLNRIYRFLFLTPPKLTNSLAEGLKRTTYSIRKLTDSEAAAIKPLRLRVIKVRSGETPAGLARLMPYAEYQRERFGVLNGLDANARLRAGDQVKLVVE